MSGRNTVPPDSVEVYGKYVSYVFNWGTREWEEDFVEDPVLDAIEAEMKKQISAAKMWFSQVEDPTNYLSKIQDAFDTIENKDDL